ncbi:MAG: hypothetical protein IAF08_06345 [Rhizobacter sp.]|nr:hypothetical protein [Chlorobiales bacterium]
MLNIAILSNGNAAEMQRLYSDRFRPHAFTMIAALSFAQTDLSPFDVFIAPTGSDHIALRRAQSKLIDFLDAGKVVLGFSGPYTQWLPNARWVMQTDIPLRLYENTLPDASHPLLQDVKMNDVNLSHGKRGFWTCGHFTPAPGAKTLMVNNLGECTMFLDDVSFKGAIIATASGPVPGFGLMDSKDHTHGLDQLFINILRWSEEKVAHDKVPR